MGIFGWSYPPGCSGPPDDYYEGPRQPRCSACGAFLPHKSDHEKLDTWEYSDIVRPGAAIPEGARVREVVVEELWGNEPMLEFSFDVSERVPMWRCRRCGAETDGGMSR